MWRFKKWGDVAIGHRAIECVAVGTTPIRISMMRPMPFPSFDPWAKLTPVHVRMSDARIHGGGGVLPFGAW